MLLFFAFILNTLLVLGAILIHCEIFVPAWSKAVELCSRLSAV